jgi:hypothetical protein
MPETWGTDKSASPYFSPPTWKLSHHGRGESFPVAPSQALEPLVRGLQNGRFFLGLRIPVEAVWVLLSVGVDARDHLVVWTGTTPNGTKAEYRYHQSRTGAWASRKVGDFLNNAKRVPHGLTRKQVEALFAKRRYNP